MIFKDKYDRYIETDVPTELEAELWQAGKVQYGYIDLFQRGEQNGRNFQHDLRNEFPSTGRS